MRVEPSLTRLRGVVFDLDDRLTDFRGVEAEVWARTVAHIRAVLPDVDADELRRRHLVLRDTLFADVLAGRADVDGFRRAHLRETAAPWGELPEETLVSCIKERDANIEPARLVVGGTASSRLPTRDSRRRPTGRTARGRHARGDPA